MAPIDPKQAIRNAIAAELAAERFYRLLADSTNDEASRAFLAELADQERAHADSIERMGKELVGGALPAHPTGEVEGIETLPSWKFIDGLSLSDAYDVALAAEQQAALYYDVFSDHFEGDMRSFFVELARAEEEHARQLIERRQQG